MECLRSGTFLTGFQTTLRGTAPQDRIEHVLYAFSNNQYFNSILKHKNKIITMILSEGLKNAIKILEH